MNLEAIILELRSELERVNRAIMALEGLSLPPINIAVRSANPPAMIDSVTSQPMIAAH